MTQRREDLRVADVDRAFVADRLKHALDEGRLTLMEYDERLRDAYAAKTYGDLDRLLGDLPGPAVPAQQAVVPAAPAPAPAQPMVGALGGAAGGQAADVPAARAVPRWLAAVWGAWFFAVSVNVVIWLLVSVSADGGPVYFWPMWVAGPWGAILLATTVTGLLSGAPHKAAVQSTERAERHARRAAVRLERHSRRIADRAARRASRRSF